MRKTTTLAAQSAPADAEAPEDDVARARAVVAAVVDPEIPVLTLADLGILRSVERRNGELVVELTPTYTGCPATLAIRLAVEAALAAAGMADVRVLSVLSPPWSTDWITEAGRRKLREFGIAPPRGGEQQGAVCRSERGVPQMRFNRHDQDLRIRLHGVQGAMALRGVR